VQDATPLPTVAERLQAGLARVIVGADRSAFTLLVALLAGGHALIEGVPGTAKTLTVRVLSRLLGLDYARIQFTPDLMPSDVIGTTVFDQRSATFSLRRGPIFTNVLLADEINRTPPKTQAALLEAMQESQVTIDGEAHPLPPPFFVCATQNPIEFEGTYPLPEAQLDRFFFKLHVPFPGRDDLHQILDLTTGSGITTRQAVLNREDILQMQQLVRQVPVARHVQDYAVRVLQASHPDGPDAPDLTKRFVRYGSSPRGAQAMLLASKIRALFDGRFAASVDDVRAVAHPALRHRVLLNFEGEAEGIKTDQVIDAILKAVPEGKAEKTVAAGAN
jgi:MoxR-like ATPase